MKRSRHLIANLNLSPITKPSWRENIQVYTHEKETGIIVIEPGSSSVTKPIDFAEESLSKLLSLRHRRLQITKYFSSRRWLLHRSTVLLWTMLLVASILLTLGGQSLAGLVAILIGGVATIGMASLNIWLDLTNHLTLDALDHELMSLVSSCHARWTNPRESRPLSFYISNK